MTGKSFDFGPVHRLLGIFYTWPSRIFFLQRFHENIRNSFLDTTVTLEIEKVYSFFMTEAG